MNIHLGTFRKFTYWFFLLYVGALLAFSDTMGMFPVKLAGYKFYGADLVLLFLGLVLLFYGLDRPFRTRIAFTLLIMLLFGFFNVLRGYLIGYGLNDVIGDFRRLYLYSIAFGISWVMMDSPGKLKKLNQVAYIALIPVIIISLLRAYTGVSWSVNYEAEDLRAVSYATATVLFWVFFDASSRLLIRSKDKSWLKNLIWVFVAGFALLISNYRALWLLPVLGLFVMILTARLKGMMHFTKIVVGMVWILLVAALVVLVLQSAFSDIFNLIETKFVEGVLGFKWQDSFRYFSWGEAWNQFKTNPLLGVGLGHRLQYWLLNSAGDWYVRESTAHNIFIDYFYQTGLVGGILFLIPHYLFVTGIWRSLRRLPREYSRPAIAMFVTYFSMLVWGSLQPFLTIPSVAVLFYIIMGITSRWIYWGYVALRRDSLENRII